MGQSDTFPTRPFPICRNSGADCMDRRAITVSGIVQGVGFRPFVYALASDMHLHGFVKNSAGSVLIEVEGDSRDLDVFVDALTKRPPPLGASIACSGPHKRRAEIRHSRSNRATSSIRLPYSSLPISRHATTAWPNYSNPAIAATVIHFSTAPIAGRASPSSRDRPMTASARQWRRSPCATRAEPNMTIPTTVAFMPNQPRARTAGLD